ncbi:MAG: contractile injection system protein, VgrG/Pvc8 family [Pseudomonadales bacterium]
MNLQALEKKYGNFYVPSFKVAVDGQDLVRDLFLTVTRLEVDLKQKSTARFSFTVANAFDWETREFLAKSSGEQSDLLALFAFGKSVEAFFGYGEASKLSSLFKGIVTEISTNFSSGDNPELTVSGYDSLFGLTTGKSTRNWEDKKDSDAVQEILSALGVSTDVQTTSPQKNRIDQNQEADMAFVKKLAERNGYTFYLRDGSFYFGPRNNTSSAIIEIGLGKGLFSFNPEVNLARQVEAVEVTGWSASEGKAIIGRASKNDETGRDSGGASGAEQIASALNTQPTMRVRASVHTQAEADARAKSMLEERAQEYLQGDGESIGLPDIVPDVNIALKDLGTNFSKTYYVKDAKHSVDSSGYRTTFSVQETTL